MGLKCTDRSRLLGLDHDSFDNDFTNHIIRNYLSYQETISIEEWSVGIRNGSSFKIIALYYLIVGEKLKELPDNIISAYKDYLMQLAKGQILIEPSDFRSTITNGH